jgi:hypothetical protein
LIAHPEKARAVGLPRPEHHAPFGRLTVLLERFNLFQGLSGLDVQFDDPEEPPAQGAFSAMKNRLFERLDDAVGGLFRCTRPPFRAQKETRRCVPAAANRRRAARTGRPPRA